MLQGSQPGSNSEAVIAQFPKTGSGAGDFSVIQSIPQVSLPSLNGPSIPGGPAGFAANDMYVAWTITADLDDSGASCEVFSQQLLGSDATGSATQLMATEAYSCTGAAVDGSGAVYFSICSAEQDNNNNGNNNGGGNSEFHCLGIGRIGVDGSYASISTGTPRPRTAARGGCT